MFAPARLAAQPGASPHPRGARQLPTAVTKEGSRQEGSRGKAPGEGFPGLLGRFFVRVGEAWGGQGSGQGGQPACRLSTLPQEFIHALEPMGAGRRPHRPR